ncbi:MAG: alpha-(1-_3)-arabinofuranosyltransferase family protein, partial [Candidatus Daviesbacteria bacterium]|nr:alpha-(1->3)-arabinofuranosyltransferase family protein [Candidatus Daviesbacteria bacterium]
MEIIKRFFVPIFIVLVATILVASWFHEGYILGTAEAEIPFYNLERYKNITSWAWTDLFLGNSASLTLASAPSWWILSKIQVLGLPGFIIQAVTMWFLFVSAGFGVFRLTNLLFPKLSNRYLILAILFYWFNPMSVVNVWNRFLYNYMVFWALLPIALYLYIKGLKEKNLIFGITLALTLTIFSYALSAYIFNILLWFVLIFTSLFFIIIYLKKEFTLFSFKFFSITLASFLIFNCWWILPSFVYISSKETAQEISSFISPAGNLYTLTILSKKLGSLIDITRLIQMSFYLDEGPQWAILYNSPLFVSLLFIISGLIFFGIYRLRKQRETIFLSVLFILAIFAAKGNNPPFGGVFQYLFEKLIFLQAFRNPFEKFGFLIPLFAALLFSIGVQEFLKILNSKLKLPVYFFILATILGVFGYPFFSGRVFTSKTPPNDNYDIGFKVKVPLYYQDTDHWLQSQGTNFRFISLPIGNEGMTYKWEKGYQGVEPSKALFSTSGITFNTSIPYYSQIVDQLERLFFEGKNFSKIANILNVRYLLVRSDVDIRERRLRDPQVIENRLSKKEKEGEFKKVNQFGNLTLWENLNWEDKTVYISNKLIVVVPTPIISDVLFQQVNSTDVLVSQSAYEKSTKKVGLEIIHPQGENNPNQNPQIFEQQKKYHFTLDEEASYELLLDNAQWLEREASIAAQLKIFLDNKLILEQPQYKQNKILSLGKSNLSVGRHEIIIERPMSQNLISTPDSIILNSAIDFNQSSFDIRNFDPYSKYFVEFNYFIKSGQEFVRMFQQSNDLIRQGKIVPQYPYFNVLTQENFNGFRHVSGIYTPQRSEKASILFWTDPSKNTEVVIKNISVNRLIEPTPVLIKENPKVDIPLPQVTYTKHNPSKYSVQIKGA